MLPTGDLLQMRQNVSRSRQRRVVAALLRGSVDLLQGLHQRSPRVVVSTLREQRRHSCRAGRVVWIQETDDGGEKILVRKHVHGWLCSEKGAAGGDFGVALRDRGGLLGLVLVVHVCLVCLVWLLDGVLDDFVNNNPLRANYNAMNSLP